MDENVDGSNEFLMENQNKSSLWNRISREQGNLTETLEIVILDLPLCHLHHELQNAIAVLVNIKKFVILFVPRERFIQARLTNPCQ